MNRLSPLYTAANPTEAMAEIDRLHELFRNIFRKNLGAELFLYSAGPIRGADYGISLYWDDESAADARWVRENVLQSA